MSRRYSGSQSAQQAVPPIADDVAAASNRSDILTPASEFTEGGKIKSWRNVISVHRAADLFPMMPPDERIALGEDIAKKGMTSPIAITAERRMNGEWRYFLLDGRNRLDAMELAGVEFTLVLKDGKCTIESPLDYMKTGGVFPEAIVVAEADAYDYVISTNIRRRHLTPAQRIELLETVLKANPAMSARRAAKLAGVSPTTGAKVRHKLEDVGDVSTVDTAIDSKGRKQPTRKPSAKKRRDVDDYLAEKKTRLAWCTTPTRRIRRCPTR